MGRRRSSWALIASCAALVLFASCKPKPGGKCQVGQAVCEDPGNVLACQGGVFVEAHCRGPGGCTKLGTKITCDDSVATEGEPCLESETENRACSVDKKKSLVCDDGKFKLVQYCRGPNGCTIRGELVTCDATLADRDEPCTTPGVNACTPDLKTRVVCKGGKWAFDRVCRGVGGCNPQQQFTCDESLSEIGDPCGVTGMVVCSDDGREELVCQGGQFVRSRECKKSGCHVMQKRIECQ